MFSEKIKNYLNQTWYIVSFILLLSFFSAAFLSTVYYILAPFQERAATFDRNKQMLTAAHIIDYSGRFQIYEKGHWEYAIYDKQSHLLKAVDTLPPVVTSSILDAFSKNFIRPLLTDKKGQMFSLEEKNITLSEFLNGQEQSNSPQQPLLLFYVVLSNTEQARTMTTEEIIKNPLVIQSIILPISGFGLWGPMYGYLGLENDGNTVLGTAWYQQGETPGLGANITNPQWQKQFYGKKVFLQSSTGNVDLAAAPLGLEVVKGSAETLYGTSPKVLSTIDGISGATLTCNGVTEAYTQSLAPYRNLLLYFAKLHTQRDPHDK
ncbi:NADH:ubiquinone reductase (Na(+)-transporting) subunit C [Chlamydia avium]|uniref:Na(+)-translocating NADH-quinone reductase subunit C n=1 Tax=Chlamydia avium 10DC88 TaxID=1229831 RepID=W8JQB5_9CHLA|nr:NADH:ubiquinone reductase (Na(+)-transporting) subunit C [Chlamydia avium]AHK63043.1 Na(+)-translocating NADH-quinone reductase subunit C [Chlamydia avium 10DC88]